MKYLHATSFFGAQAKPVAICVPIAASLLASGCNLPLCDNGDMLCKYEIVNSDFCIEKCNPESKQVCPETCYCEDDDEGCISYHSKSINHKCTIQVCENDLWQSDKICDGGFSRDVCLPKCKYGFDERNYTCFNPCNICDSTECPNAIYDIDNGVVYKCDSTNGWRIDNTCFNDFSRDYDVHLNITHEEFYIKYLKDLYNNINDATKYERAEYVYGRCGECSENTSPVFCNISGDVMHRCVNGRRIASKTEMETCKTNLCNDDDPSQCLLLSCKDEYGYVWVNSDSNHNHCGKCNFKCGASQSCVNGKCKSNVHCNDGDYVQMQLGARWVNAYCVGSVDSLKKIGKVPDNLDNAYILVDDININEPWVPMEPMDNGILFGNDKTIWLKAGFSEPLGMKENGYAGLFSQVNNSYISDLRIKYSNPDQLSSGVMADYFGMLAGTVRSSNIYRVEVSSEQPVMVLNAVAAGGLIGKAEYGVTVSYVKMQIQIDADNKLSSEDIVQSESGVGGVIGVVKNINELSNVNTASENTASESLESDVNPGIKVTGARNVGGLIGWVGYDESIDTPQKIDNGDAESLSVLVSGEECVGGVVGKLPVNMEIQKQILQIQNFDLDHVQLKLLNNDNVHGCKSGEKHMRFFGGVLGGVQFTYAPKLTILDIRNIKINDVSLDEELYGKPVAQLCGSSKLGGISGDLRNATLENIYVKQFSIADATTFTYMIGGIAGVAFDNIRMTDCWVDAFAFLSTNPGCGYVGGISGTTNTGVYTNIHVGNEDSESVKLNCNSYIGGIAGQADSSVFDATDVRRVEIAGSTKIGGLVGNATSVEFNHNHADSLVLKASGNYVGGMVGYASKLTVNHSSVNDAIITGSQHLGGIAGYETGTAISNASVDRLNISGKEKIGGFIGTSNSTLNIKYASASSKLQSKACCTAGLVGHLKGKNVTIAHGIVESGINSAASSGGLIGSVADTNRTLNLSYVSAYTSIRRKAASKQSGAYRGGLIGPVNPKTMTLNALGTSAVSNIHTVTVCNGDETNKSNRIYAGYWYGSKAVSDTSRFLIGYKGYSGYLVNNLAIGYIVCDNCKTDSPEMTNDESITCYNDACGDVNNKVHSLCVDNLTQSYLPLFSHAVYKYISASPMDDLYINDPVSKYSKFECTQIAECSDNDSCEDDSSSSNLSQNSTIYLESINDLIDSGWNCNDNHQCTTVVNNGKYVVNLNDCIPLYHALSCDIEKFKTAIGCCTSEGQADCDKACSGLIARLNPDDQGQFVLPVPVSTANHESDDVVNEICRDNMMVCDEGEIPLCLNDSSPLCDLGRQTPVCSDGSTPRCYNIMVPSFCSL